MSVSTKLINLPQDIIYVIAAIMSLPDACALLTTCKAYYALYVGLHLRTITTQHYGDIVIRVDREDFCKEAANLIGVLNIYYNQLDMIARFGTVDDIRATLGEDDDGAAYMLELAIQYGNVDAVNYLSNHCIVTDQHRCIAMQFAKPAIIKILEMPAKTDMCIYSADDKDLTETVHMCPKYDIKLTIMRMFQLGDTDGRILPRIHEASLTDSEHMELIGVAIVYRRATIVEQLCTRNQSIEEWDLLIIFRYCIDPRDATRRDGIRLATFFGLEKFVAMLGDDVYSDDLIRAVLADTSIEIPMTNRDMIIKNSGVDERLKRELSERYDIANR